jgi:hypothetical protein
VAQQVEAMALTRDCDGKRHDNETTGCEFPPQRSLSLVVRYHKCLFQFKRIVQSERKGVSGRPLFSAQIRPKRRAGVGLDVGLYFLL